MGTTTHEQEHGKPETETKLHIFVNRRKFDVEQGVKATMTGSEIAALIGLSAENAVVRKESGPDRREIGINETVEIKVGDHFLVTRKVVEGGYAS